MMSTLSGFSQVSKMSRQTHKSVASQRSGGPYAPTMEAVAEHEAASLPPGTDCEQRGSERRPVARCHSSHPCRRCRPRAALAAAAPWLPWEVEQEEAPFRTLRG